MLNNNNNYYYYNNNNNNNNDNNNINSLRHHRHHYHTLGSLYTVLHELSKPSIMLSASSQSFLFQLHSQALTVYSLVCLYLPAEPEIWPPEATNSTQTLQIPESAPQTRFPTFEPLIGPSTTDPSHLDPTSSPASR
ncbi:hypothetical protein VSDG_09822 [Cytospora chrysosperma]|uniref:Uncharacterized protein n=1 Tax=Cytospora chrysosperma TaxID=252740 RepID=A0A423V900_CYTCH|nr:hypothetical protein VSDG_09822 [Valsa sordida]